MNKETLKALKGSIKKWQAIVKSPKARQNGSNDCPLCTLFRNFKGCGQCPIVKKIPTLYCQETPFNDFCRHIIKEHNITNHREKGCKECIRLAKQEVVFLQSLLPKRS